MQADFKPYLCLAAQNAAPHFEDENNSITKKGMIITMKKTYELENLDCANCAAKMEEAIKKIDGVKSASVSFIMQKLTLEAEEELMPDIIKKTVKVCRKIEPDCEIKI